MEGMKCTYAYVECKDGSKDTYRTCELTLDIDSLFIKEGDLCNWYSRDCLKYFAFMKESD